MKVKICGVNSAAAIDAAAQAGADWIGFVFAPRSPRYVTAQQAAQLSRRLLHGPRLVGLFVDPDDAALAGVLGELPLDALQLYAPPARCRDIALATGVPVWRSVPVATAADLPRQADADAWVIEPRPAAGASRPGGNGIALDWSELRGWRTEHPWLLAGGLTPANVGRAIAESGASAVDVSSGVETSPGVKSPELIAAFVVAAKQQGSGSFLKKRTKKLLDWGLA